MKIKNLVEAQEYLNQYIAQGGFKYPGEVGIKRTRYFLKLLDNPQNKLKVIHIAGTSGKGSTAYYISTILYALGKKVGLHVSPHLIDLRERFQINNELINEREFCEYLEEVIPYIEKVDELNLGKITYFEVCIGLVYYIFYQKKVDYAVIETGLGGLFDATNVVDSPDKIAVVTRIGFDHTEILGNTLKEIAFQKAGIIKKNNTVFTIEQKKEVMKVIEETVKGLRGKGKGEGEKLYLVDSFKRLDTNISHSGGFPPIHDDVGTGLPSRSKWVSSPYKNELNFYFSFLDKSFEVELNESAEYQIENCCLALSVCVFISKRDGFIFNIYKVTNVLKNAHFKGRMDVIGNLVIDGAHNPQKMKAFTKSLMKRYPDKRFTFLLAMKSGKDYYDTIKYILPLAKKVILTSFNIATQQGMSGVVSEKPEVLKSILEEMGYIPIVDHFAIKFIKNDPTKGYASRNVICDRYKNIDIIPDVKNAYQALIDEQGIVVVTGSLYLVSEVYKILNSK